MKLTRRSLFAAITGIPLLAKVVKPQQDTGTEMLRVTAVSDTSMLVIRDDTISLTINDLKRLETLNGPGQDGAIELIRNIRPFFPGNSFPRPQVRTCNDSGTPVGVFLDWGFPWGYVNVTFYSGVGGLRTKSAGPSVYDNFITHATPATLARELKGSSPIDYYCCGHRIGRAVASCPFCSPERLCSTRNTPS